MKYIGLASASILAFSMAMGAAAGEQHSGSGIAGLGPAPQANGSSPHQHLGTSELKQKLKQAGIKDRKMLHGHVATAQAPSGDSVELILGPHHFKEGKAAHNFDRDQVRAKLTKAGFKKVHFAGETNLIRGQISGGTQVIAISGNNSVAPDVPHAKSPGTGSLQNDLKDVGFKSRGAFKGELLTARVGGAKAAVLVGPKDFKVGESAGLSAKDLIRLQHSGFSHVRVVKHVSMAEGEMNKMQVIAIAGKGLRSTTGSVH